MICYVHSTGGLHLSDSRRVQFTLMPILISLLFLFPTTALFAQITPHADTSLQIDPLPVVDANESQNHDPDTTCVVRGWIDFSRNRLSDKREMSLKVEASILPMKKNGTPFKATFPVYLPELNFFGGEYHAGDYTLYPDRGTGSGSWTRLERNLLTLIDSYPRKGEVPPDEPVVGTIYINKGFVYKIDLESHPYQYPPKSIKP